MKFLCLLFLLCLKIHLAWGITKEWGIGDQGVAYPQSTLSIRFNPAGITKIGSQMDGMQGFLYRNGHGEIKGSPQRELNQRRSLTQSKWWPVGVAGISKQINDRLTVVMNLEATRTAKCSSNQGFRALGKGDFGSEIDSPIISVGAGWKVTDRHSIGISVPFYVSRVMINGLQNLRPMSIHPHHVCNKGYDYATAVSVRLGWLWEPLPYLNIGVSYFFPTYAASHFKKYKGLIPEHGLFQDPAVLRVGFMLKVNPRMNLAFEYEYVYYDNQRTLHNSVSSTAPLGSKHGPSFGWRNQPQWKIGFDYRIHPCFVVRMGWIYVQRPNINRDNAFGNLANPYFVVQNAAFFGATWERGRWEFSMAVGYALYRKVTSRPVPALNGGRVSVEHQQPSLFIGIAKKF